MNRATGKVVWLRKHADWEQSIVHAQGAQKFQPIFSSWEALSFALQHKESARLRNHFSTQSGAAGVHWEQRVFIS